MKKPIQGRFPFNLLFKKKRKDKITSYELRKGRAVISTIVIFAILAFSIYIVFRPGPFANATEYVCSNGQKVWSSGVVLYRTDGEAGAFVLQSDKQEVLVFDDIDGMVAQYSSLSYFPPELVGPVKTTMQNTSGQYIAYVWFLDMPKPSIATEYNSILLNKEQEGSPVVMCWQNASEFAMTLHHAEIGQTIGYYEIGQVIDGAAVLAVLGNDIPMWEQFLSEKFGYPVVINPHALWDGKTGLTLEHLNFINQLAQMGILGPDGNIDNVIRIGIFEGLEDGEPVLIRK